ncbi:MAG: glycogen synthase GlgA [Vicinamibacteria bacterium]
MNIVLVSPEVEPLAKTGGLADVAASLSVALRRAKQNVSVVMPFYRAIDTETFKVQNTGLEVEVPLDRSTYRGRIWRYGQGVVPVYLLENRDLYDREGLYSVGGADYPDNALRFAFFSRAALEASRVLDLRPDVFHINDWQSALLPVYKRLYYREEASLRRAGVLLSIHNMVYQGVFDRSELRRLHLPGNVFHMDGLEFFGQLNLLKGGLVYADLLSTVSPTYAKEIQTPEAGAGLEGVLHHRAGELFGILNGIDTSMWNPGRDKKIFTNYTLSKPGGKSSNKSELQKSLDLNVDAKAPLAAVIARLDPQKGFDLLLEAAPKLLEAGGQLALLGSGQRRYLKDFAKLQERFRGQVSLNEGFDQELARRIYAGADLFLMPSRYEPCGLGQMIAMRYGTIPVVRRTGGLADTVIDFDRDEELGNGFAFDAFEATALVDAIMRAMARFDDRRVWPALVRRAMKTDFSWKTACQRYLDVYVLAMKKARGE